MFLGYFERNPLKENLTDRYFIFPLFHKHLFSLELPCAAHLFKAPFFNCMCNGDNARDIAACPDEESTKRSQPTNQAQIEIKLCQFLECT